MDAQLPRNIFTLNIILLPKIHATAIIIISYLTLTLLLTLLARLYNQQVAAHAACMCMQRQMAELECLRVRVYTETNSGIGKTLLHSRLSLLSIDEVPICLCKDGHSFGWQTVCKDIQHAMCS